jgi:uncharacterized protein (TIGR02328 family)
MRLWHQLLITKLPRQQLLGQHRECCALRGNGWGRKHKTVDYVFNHPFEWLVAYHYKVMKEMRGRDYNTDINWIDVGYRGKSCEYQQIFNDITFFNALDINIIYPEHDDNYLQECIENLRKKGIDIENCIL